jgi:hypothetical protein
MGIARLLHTAATLHFFRAAPKCRVTVALVQEEAALQNTKYVLGRNISPDGTRNKERFFWRKPAEVSLTDRSYFLQYKLE